MKKRSVKEQTVDLAIASRDGVFIARYSATGLAGLQFPSRRSGQLELNIAPANVARWHRVTVDALKLALSGRKPRILPPLDLSAGTAFQKTVWNQLLKIPRGETRSYGELARLLKNPRASRAVGSACGANPIPVLVPCHRVLAANHKIGGYSGGLEWKRKLLWREESRDLWKR